MELLRVALEFFSYCRKDIQSSLRIHFVVDEKRTIEDQNWETMLIRLNELCLVKREPEYLIKKLYTNDKVEYERHLSPNKIIQAQFQENVLANVNVHFQIPTLPMIIQLFALSCIHLEKEKKETLLLTQYKRRRTFGCHWPSLVFIHYDELLTEQNNSKYEEWSIMKKEIIIETIMDMEWQDKWASQLPALCTHFHQFVSSCSSSSSVTKKIPITTTTITNIEKKKQINNEDKLSIRLLKPCRNLIIAFHSAKNDVELEYRVGTWKNKTFSSGLPPVEFFTCVEEAQKVFGKPIEWIDSVDWCWDSIRATTTRNSGLQKPITYIEKKPTGMIHYKMGTLMIRFSSKTEHVISKPTGPPNAIRLKRRFTICIGNRTKTELAFTITKTYRGSDCSQEKVISDGILGYEIEAEIPSTVKNRKRIVYKTLASETLGSLFSILKCIQPDSSLELFRS